MDVSILCPSIAGFHRLLCKMEKAIRRLALQPMPASGTRPSFGRSLMTGIVDLIEADFRIAGGISKQNEDG